MTVPVLFIMENIYTKFERSPVTFHSRVKSWGQARDRQIHGQTDWQQWLIHSLMDGGTTNC